MDLVVVSSHDGTVLVTMSVVVDIDMVDDAIVGPRRMAYNDRSVFSIVKHLQRIFPVKAADHADAPIVVAGTKCHSRNSYGFSIVCLVARPGYVNDALARIVKRMVVKDLAAVCTYVGSVDDSIVALTAMRLRSCLWGVLALHLVKGGMGRGCKALNA